MKNLIDYLMILILLDDFNFALNGKRRTDKNGYSLTYEVIDNGKKCKIVLKT